MPIVINLYICVYSYEFKDKILHTNEGLDKFLTHSIHPIGHIRTPFSEKFGIPRQGAGLSSATGVISFTSDIDVTQACEGIDGFSHLWLIFQFHEHLTRGWSPKVRPPRLGGNKKIGVFASRSSFRPNQLGMSAVKFIKLENNLLFVEGVDMLDGTPIFDIKPYVAYSDSFAQAQSGFAQDTPVKRLDIIYSHQARTDLQNALSKHPQLATLIDSVLGLDPRPAYKQNNTDTKQYYVRLYDYEIEFVVNDNFAHVNSIKRVE